VKNRAPGFAARRAICIHAGISREWTTPRASSAAVQAL
jgi:hypothetical protein